MITDETSYTEMRQWFARLWRGVAPDIDCDDVYKRTFHGLMTEWTIDAVKYVHGFLQHAEGGFEVVWCDVVERAVPVCERVRGTAVACGIGNVAMLGKMCCEDVAKLASEKLPTQIQMVELLKKAVGKAPRTDKGGKHRQRKQITGAWKSALEVADDFNQARFIPEDGAHPVGGCDEAKINQWDAKYPDAKHRHPRWGYHARLRADKDSASQKEYSRVLMQWLAYWKDYKIQFKAWRKTHPKNKRSDFRFNKMLMTGIDPERLGSHERHDRGRMQAEPRKRASQY